MTPPAADAGEMSGLPICERLRSSACAFRDNTVYDSEGDALRLGVQADECIEAADTIDALYEALGYLMSTSTIEDSNRDAMRQALAVLAKARGQ